MAGTRPELIKLAPLVRALAESGRGVGAVTCFSGQHVEILESVLGDVGVAPDRDLRDLAPAGTLAQTLARLLERLDAVVAEVRPDGVAVQGDTATALAGGMVAHFHGLPLFHVEAGLRTSDPRLPFPEEMNRRLLGRLAARHFAPTERARRNLLAEGVADGAIEVTGNTGVDALRLFAGRESPAAEAILAGGRPGARRLLVTLHRRENLGRVDDVADAVRGLCAARPDVEALWILHLNDTRPRVVGALAGQPGVRLLEPQPYGAFVHLMRASHLILTDSGGVQEDAPALGRPVLVLRDETERPEAVEAGSALVVGARAADVRAACERLLDDAAIHAEMSRPRFPFGDGRAAERIAAALERFFSA